MNIHGCWGKWTLPVYVYSNVIYYYILQNFWYSVLFNIQFCSAHLYVIWHDSNDSSFKINSTSSAKFNAMAWRPMNQCGWNIAVIETQFCAKVLSNHLKSSALKKKVLWEVWPRWLEPFVEQLLPTRCGIYFPQD